MTSQGQGQLDRGRVRQDYPALMVPGQTRVCSKAHMAGYFFRQMSKYITSIDLLNIL